MLGRRTFSYLMARNVGSCATESYRSSHSCKRLSSVPGEHHACDCQLNQRQMRLARDKAADRDPISRPFTC